MLAAAGSPTLPLRTKTTPLALLRTGVPILIRASAPEDCVRPRVHFLLIRCYSRPSDLDRLGTQKRLLSRAPV